MANKHLPDSFKGVVPPISTPFNEAYEVDMASLERLVNFQIEAGVHGLFALGSTSETVFLTDKQRKTVLEVIVKTAAGRVPVLAGAIETTTARVIEQARLAEQA